ncbi:MAG: glycogen debranching protein GlgX [Phyllobacteriaceae bacterium]|nr:glycogen debranching protein GlgX [Phyllobacteriaceae bacterium]
MEFGARRAGDGVRFAVWSRQATAMWLCLFDGEAETRVDMARDGDVWQVFVPGLAAGARYGFRADGPWSPREGLKFDPGKLLVDPSALALDRPFAWHADLALPRDAAVDTAALVPKAIVVDLPAPPPRQAALSVDGRLIYEVNVRTLTMAHPDVPEAERGTLRALAHPAILAHLKTLGVAAVELMPVAAWIDERHLRPLGLENAWGYNPVVFSALDPRLAPGGGADLRFAVEALHGAGIGVLLDVVFNHTGESDEHGATLSLRGFGEADWYRRDEHGRLVNDTGCGNTFAAEQPQGVALIVDALRHFVINAGVDGFRFDLAPTMARTVRGFTLDAPLLGAIRLDPVLSDRILIAEPWDLGPGGYRLGAFPEPWLEWNDRARDDFRRFWRGDREALGGLATRLAGSSDLFRHGGAKHSRSVNFVAAHDGFALADLVAFRHRRNEANGEQNRDGHAENFSWNNGVEGPSDDSSVVAARRADARALIATLFASRGAVMLTAGDEFGRTQRGNNNAYAQNNALTWLDWTNRDRDLEEFVAALSAYRAAHPALASSEFLDGAGDAAPDVKWFAPSGAAMSGEDWHGEEGDFLGMALCKGGDRIAVVFNRDDRPAAFALPRARAGRRWSAAFGGEIGRVGPRAVAFYAETADGD